MSTVFQFGQAQFVKDMVFGWHFRPDDNHDWQKLVDFPTAALKELSAAVFPSYVPDELQSTIRGELERREVLKRQALEMGSVVVGVWFQHDQRLSMAEAVASRLRDRTKLMGLILSNMTQNEDTVSADLKYVKVSRVGVQWTIQGERDEKPILYATIDEVIDRIMARWW